MENTPGNRRARKLYEAKFDPRLKTYSYAGGIIFLTISVIGIVLLPEFGALLQRPVERHVEL